MPLELSSVLSHEREAVEDSEIRQQALEAIYMIVLQVIMTFHGCGICFILRVCDCASIHSLNTFVNLCPLPFFLLLVMLHGLPFLLQALANQNEHGSLLFFSRKNLKVLLTDDWYSICINVILNIGNCRFCY
jgi:hypothetical protein